MDNQASFLSAYSDLLEVIFLEADSKGIIVKSFGDTDLVDFNPGTWDGLSIEDLLDAESCENIRSHLSEDPPTRVTLDKGLLSWQDQHLLIKGSGKCIEDGWALALIPIERAESEEVKALRDADMYRMAVEDAYNPICITDGDARNPLVVFVNAAFCELTGYSAEELVGKNPKILQGPKTNAEVITGLRQALDAGEAWSGKTYNYRKDGTPYFVEWHVSPLRDSTGEVVRWISVQQDVSLEESLRVEAKLREERLLQAQEIAQIGGWIVDLQKNRIWWSDQVKRLHGVPLDFEPELEGAINFYHPEYREVIREAVQTCVEKQIPWDLECKFITAQEEEIWVRAVGQPVLKDGKVVQLTGIFQNIDERKRAQVEMEEYSRLITLSSDLVAICNYEGVFTHLNPQWTKTLGYSVEQLKSESFLNFVHPDDFERTEKKAIEMQENGSKAVRFRNRFRKQAGGYVWLEWNVQVGYGPLSNAYAVARDITGELEHLSQLEEYENLFELSTDLISIANFKGYLMKVNPQWGKVLGYTTEEIQSTPFLDFVHPDDVEKTIQEAAALASDKNELVSFRNRYRTKSGEYVWLDWNANSDFETQKIYSVTRDITQEIRSQQQLVEYRKLFDLSPEFMAIHTLDGELLDVNRSGRDTFGLKPEKSMINNWRRILAVADIKRMDDLFAKVVSGERDSVGLQVTSARTAAGNQVIMQWSAAIDVSQNRIYSIGRDITKQLEQEEELRRQQVMERALLATPGAMICLINHDGDIVSTNNAWEEGVKDSCVQLKNTEVGVNYLAEMERAIARGHHPLKETLTGLVGTLENGLVYSEEYPCHTKNEKRWFRMSVEPIPIDGGGAVISYLNITEKKITEEGLKRAQSRLNLLSKNLREVFWIRDRDTLHFISDSCETLWSMSKSEFETDPNLFMKYVHPEDLERVKEANINHLKGKPLTLEYRLLMPGGQVRWTMVRGDAVQGPDGKQIFVGTATDITHQKKVEASLKDALEEKDVLIREIHHRVKNNLQLISSILYLNELEARDDKLLAFIRDTENRIRSLSSIHERLLQAKGFGYLQVKPYLEGLISDFSTSYTREGLRVDYQLKIQDVVLHVDVVTTLGLLVNELVSNSLKHAFVSRENGKIDIEFIQEDENFMLVVQDDGIGLPESHSTGPGGLGFQFIEVFMSQLAATSEVKTEGGVAFKIRIPKPEKKDNT